MSYQNLETERKKFRNKAILSILTIFGIEAVALILTMLSVKAIGFENYFKTMPVFAYGILICINIFVILVTTAFVKNKAIEYRKAYKAHFVSQVTSKIFKDLQYDFEKGLNKKILDDTGIINTSDFYSSNDLMTGIYKNTAFTQANAIVKKIVPAGDYYGYHRIFKGQFIVFEFPQKFKHELIMTSRFFRAHKNLNSFLSSNQKYKRIKTDSSKINIKYKLYIKNEPGTSSLPDPTLISKIKKLNSKYNKNMLLYFTGDKLYVGINNKYLFEPPYPFKKIDDRAEDNRIRQQIKIITDFIDTLSNS